MSHCCQEYTLEELRAKRAKLAFDINSYVLLISTLEYKLKRAVGAHQLKLEEDKSDATEKKNKLRLKLINVNASIVKLQEDGHINTAPTLAPLPAPAPPSFWWARDRMFQHPITIDRNLAVPPLRAPPLPVRLAVPSNQMMSGGAVQSVHVPPPIAASEPLTSHPDGTRDLIPIPCESGVVSLPREQVEMFPSASGDAVPPVNIKVSCDLEDGRAAVEVRGNTTGVRAELGANAANQNLPDKCGCGETAAELPTANTNALFAAQNGQVENEVDTCVKQFMLEIWEDVLFKVFVVTSPRMFVEGGFVVGAADDDEGGAPMKEVLAPITEVDEDGEDDEEAYYTCDEFDESEY